MKVSENGVMTGKYETLRSELDSEIMLSLRLKSGESDGGVKDRNIEKFLSSSIYLLDQSSRLDSSEGTEEKLQSSLTLK